MNEFGLFFLLQNAPNEADFLGLSNVISQNLSQNLVYWARFGGLLDEGEEVKVVPIAPQLVLLSVEEVQQVPCVLLLQFLYQILAHLGLINGPFIRVVIVLEWHLLIQGVIFALVVLFQEIHQALDFVVADVVVIQSVDEDVDQILLVLLDHYRFEQSQYIILRLEEVEKGFEGLLFLCLDERLHQELLLVLPYTLLSDDVLIEVL